MGKGDPQGGRPRVEIDMEMLTNMVRIQCTAEECARILGISSDTIDRRLKEATGAGFAEFYKKHSDEGKMSLRRAQYQTAMGGNPTMQIFLGKQWLGQRDKVDVDTTSSDGSMTPGAKDLSDEELEKRLAALGVTLPPID